MHGVDEVALKCIKSAEPSANELATFQKEVRKPDLHVCHALICSQNYRHVSVYQAFFFVKARRFSHQHACCRCLCCARYAIEILFSTTVPVCNQAQCSW